MYNSILLLTLIFIGGKGGGIFWIFGPGTHAIASIELKFSDFIHMVVGLLEKKFVVIGKWLPFQIRPFLGLGAWKFDFFQFASYSW